jgi:hypothetical protein
MNPTEARDEALEWISDVRTELARLHWYAHRFLHGTAGVTKEGALLEFADATSEIGMSLNFLAERVRELGDAAAAPREAEAAR